MLSSQWKTFHDYNRAFEYNEIILYYYDIMLRYVIFYINMSFCVLYTTGDVFTDLLCRCK